MAQAQFRPLKGADMAPQLAPTAGLPHVAMASLELVTPTRDSRWLPTTYHLEPELS